MESLVRINTTVCFFGGLSLNSLLCYLILWHSTDELRVYARILLQTVILNSLYLCAVYVFAPICVASTAGAMYYGVGPLVRTSIAGGVVDAEARTWNIALYALCVYTVCAIQFTLGAQFIFRYRALCHGSVMSGWGYASMLAATLLITASLIPFVLFSNSSTPPPIEIFDAGGLPHNASVAVATVGLPDDRMSSLSLLFSTVLTLGLYVLIAGCSVRIWLYIRRSVADLPVESRIHASQVNTIFVIQAMVPTLFDFVPTMLIRGLRVARYSAGPYTTTYAMMIFNWGPLFNALAVFVVVRPYRKALSGVAKRLCGGSQPMSSKVQSRVSALFTVRSIYLALYFHLDMVSLFQVRG